MFITEKREIEAKMAEAVWLDPEFAHRLQTNGVDALKEIGVHVSDGLQVTLHEDTDDHVHFQVPQNPVPGWGGIDEEFVLAVTSPEVAYLTPTTACTCCSACTC